MESVKLDKGTVLEILYDYRWKSMTVEELSDKYGLPESVIAGVIFRNRR